MVESPLRQWTRHRVDYRGPLLLAALLLGACALLVPGRWWLLGFLGRPPRPALPERLSFAEAEDGLQVVDPRLLPPSAPGPVPSRAEAVVPTRAAPGEPVEPPASGGEGDASFDPTRAYRLTDELLLPAAPKDSLEARLGYLLSWEGSASLALEDTSAAGRARAEFLRLQRLYFAERAPEWAYQKAVARYKELLSRMLHDDPLRGPQ